MFAVTPEQTFPMTVAAASAHQPALQKGRGEHSLLRRGVVSMTDFARIIDGMAVDVSSEPDLHVHPDVAELVAVPTTCNEAGA